LAITISPDLTNHFVSMSIAAITSLVWTFAIPMLDETKIDDILRANSAHLNAGLWGTLSVGIFGGGDLMVQIEGILLGNDLVEPLLPVLLLYSRSDNWLKRR
jgi:Ammonia permease